MKSDLTTRYEDSRGVSLHTVIADASGRTLFSFPGAALIGILEVEHAAGRTVILPGRMPLSTMTALLGLSAHQAIGHSIFGKGAEIGDARVCAVSIMGDALFIEFDRDVAPAADQSKVLPEGRLCVRYASAIEVDLSVIPSSGSDEVVTTS